MDLVRASIRGSLTRAAYPARQLFGTGFIRSLW
jgi:hypothetical protein